MFRTRTKKILRDLSARKFRTALVSLSIFIGVLGVVTLISAGQILVNQLEEDLQEDRLKMLRIIMTSNSNADIDNDAFLESLNQVEGVSEVEARAAYPFFWRSGDEGEFLEAIIVSHSEPFEESQIEPTRILEGRYPEVTEGDGVEIAVEVRFAEENGVELGDTLQIRVFEPLNGPSESTEEGDSDTPPFGKIITDTSSNASQTDAETRVIEANVVGIILQPYGVELGFTDISSLVWAQLEDAQEFAGFNGFNLTLARYDSFDLVTDESVRDFESAIRQNSPYVPVNTSRTDPSENPQIEQTQQTSLILAFLAVIALVVSGFLILNVIISIVSEQRRQIGIMKSLGASGADNFFIYTGIAVAYGIFGTIPGVLLGIPAGYFVAEVLADFFTTYLREFSVVPSAILIGLFLGIGIPLLSSIIPVFAGIRVSILDAITDLGIGSKFGRGRIERAVGRLPMPIFLRQSFNNAYQKKLRLLLTGLTLTLASAAFMGIFSVFFGLVTVTEETFGIFGNELSVLPNEGQDFNEISTLIDDEIDGIDSIEPGVTLSIQLPEYQLPEIVAGPPGVNGTGYNTATDIVNLTYTEGTGWDDNADRDGVVIASAIAEETGLEVGQNVDIVAGGNRETFEVIGIANFPFNNVWFKWEDLALLGGLVLEDGTPYANSIDINLTGDDLNEDQVEDKIDEINDVLVSNSISSQYNNNIEFAGIITQILTIFGQTLSVASFLIAAVGGVGLLTTLSISVFERQKEIGVMRSVGATSTTVATQFITEGVVVGIIAWLISLPISIFIRNGLLANLPFGDTFDIPYPPETLLISFVGLMVLVIVSSLWPSFIAARKTVSEILRYQ